MLESLRRVDDAATAIVAGRARNGEQGGGDQAARRGFRDGDGFAARHELVGNFVRDGDERFHAGQLSRRNRAAQAGRWERAGLWSSAPVLRLRSSFNFAQDESAPCCQIAALILSEVEGWAGSGSCTR